MTDTTSNILNFLEQFELLLLHYRFDCNSVIFVAMRLIFISFLSKKRT